MIKNYTIYETDEHGVFLKINDIDLGDKFDDYLSEKAYALFDISHHTEYVEFSFGKAASISKVQLITDEFEKLEAKPVEKNQTG